MAFFVLTPTTDEPSLVDEEWLNAFLRRYEFSCKHFDFSARVDPIVIRELGEDVAYNFVDRASGEYIRHDLLELLSPEFERAFVLGHLVLSDGSKVQNVRTFWSGRQVRLRGGPESQCWRCPTCKQVIYYPMGARYLLQKDIPESPVFLAEVGGFVLSEPLYQRLQGRKWKKLRIAKLPILRIPRDEFPLDLETITPDQERKWNADDYQGKR